MVNLTEQEKHFLETYKPMYDVVLKSNYCKNFTKEIYNTLSEIHIKYIGKHNYTSWCVDCKMLLLKSVYRWYESLSQENITESIPVIDQPKKRGRKKKIEIK